MLARAYKASREDIAAAIDGHWRSEEIIIENTEDAYCGLAARRKARAIDFSNVLIAETGRLAGASEPLAFDRRAAGESALRLVGAAKS